MSYPDFSSVFPTPYTNYPCSYNPNSGYANDCSGTSSTEQNVVTSTSGPSLCKSSNTGFICSINNMSCIYDYTKNPPLMCSDKYCDYYYTGTQNDYVYTTFDTLLNKNVLRMTPSFSPPNINLPNSNISNVTRPYATSCNLGNNRCIYDPTQTPQLQCNDGSCIYKYSNSNQIYDLTFNPPFLPPPDSRTCSNHTPSNYQPKYAYFSRVPGPSASTSSKPAPPPSIGPISNLFTLNKWALPITIPSILTTDQVTSGNPPDPNASIYWIQPPYVSQEGYSDIYPFNQGVTPWTGFHQALSKCVELDGSTYPVSTNLCSDTNVYSSTNRCTDPLVAYPNKKPKCYAVSTQSDYVGNKTQDTSNYVLNYFLVEEPNSSPRSSLYEFNIDGTKPGGTGWVDRHNVDENYLFCQPLFYTWIKSKPSGGSYNPPCTPVTCDRSTPSCSPVTCPPGSWNNTFNVNNTCSAPVFASNQPRPKPPVWDNSMTPSFWAAKIPEKPKVLVNPPSESYTSYYIIGSIVVALGLLLWYFIRKPNIPYIPPIVTKTVNKVVKSSVKATTKVANKGGYFYYDFS